MKSNLGNQKSKTFWMLILLVIMLSVIMLILPAVSAQIYKQNDIIDLKIQCIINGTYCSTSAYCNATVTYPNGTLLISNEQMTNQFSFYNYTLPDSSIIGDYLCSTTCCDSSLCGTDSSCDFTINGIGSQLTTPQSILYIIILVGLLIILLFTIWGAIVMPWRNPRDDETGMIVGINDLKYLKVVLWIFVYLEVLFMVLIFKNLAGGFLAIEGTYSFFNVLYTIMLIAMLPFFPLLIFYTIVIWINDKKTQKAIIRGIPVS